MVTDRRYKGGRHERRETERFQANDYEELVKRDKANLDMLPPAVSAALRLWLKDEALEDSANLSDPGVIAQDIMEDLQAALEQFATIAEDLNQKPS